MRRKKKGSALIEFVLVLPVLLALWIGLYKLNSLFVIKQKLAVAARYGSWLNRDGTEKLRIEKELKAELSRAALLKSENCIITGLSKEIRPIYRDTESVVGLKYRIDNIYSKTPLILEETFSLSHNSWATPAGKKRNLDPLKDKETPKWQDIFFP